MTTTVNMTKVLDSVYDSESLVRSAICRLFAEEHRYTSDEIEDADRVLRIVAARLHRVAHELASLPGVNMEWSVDYTEHEGKNALAHEIRTPA
jgi:hypothetical protein